MSYDKAAGIFDNRLPPEDPPCCHESTCTADCGECDKYEPIEKEECDE